MATAVNIQVVMDEKGAVTGINNIGTQFDVLQTRAAGAGASGQRAGDQTKKGMLTGTDAARLFNKELDLGLNKTMLKVIGNSTLLSNTLKLMLPIGIFAGFLPMLEGLASGIATAAHNFGGLTDEVKKYNDENVKANADAMTHIKSAVDGQAKLKLAIQAVGTQQQSTIRTFAQGAHESNQFLDTVTFGVSSIVAGYKAMNDATNEQIKAERNLQSTVQALGEYQREQTKQQLEDQLKISDAYRVTYTIGQEGFAKLTTEHLAALDKISQEEAAQVVLAGTNAQAIAKAHSDAIDKRAVADITYTLQSGELHRHLADETRKLDDSVALNFVTGEDKIRLKAQQTIEEIVTREKRGAVDRINAERQVADAKAQMYAELAAYRQKKDEEAIAAAQRFGEEAFAAERNISLRTMTERQRVIAEGENQILDLQHKFDALSIGEQEKNEQLLGEAKIAIRQDTANKLRQIDQKVADDTAAANERAAIAMLPPWERANAEIVASANDEIAKLRRARENDMQNASLYDRQIADVTIEAHSKMVDSLASDLESFADDIGSGNLGKRILGNFKKMFFQILAQWIATMQGMRSTTAGSAAGGSGAGILGSILGGLFGVHVGGGGGGGFGIPGVSGTGGVVGTPPFVGNGFLGGSSMLAPGVDSGMVLGGGGVGGGAAGTASDTTLSGTTSIGGLGGTLASGVGAKGLAGVGALLGIMGAGKFGGAPAMIGAGMATIGLMAQLGNNPNATALAAATGLPPAIFGGIAGAGIGFGIGMQTGKVGGMLSGGISGAILGGLMAGGPIGAVIGGIIGLLGGLFGGLFGGSKRRKQANAFADSEIAQISKIEAAYRGFQLDFASAIADLEGMRTNDYEQLRKLKGEGKDVFNKKLSPAIDRAEADIRGFETERQRREGLYFGPPQFASGGYTGDGAASAFAGVVHNREFVLNARATAFYGRVTLEAMNRMAASPGGGTVNLTVNALDAASFRDWVVNRGGGKALRQAFAGMAAEGR